MMELVQTSGAAGSRQSGLWVRQGNPRTKMVAPISVTVDFSGPGKPYKTYTTLQVVTSPLLDREIAGKPNPIADEAWKSLANLGSEHTRFQPWFPFPRKAVAELRPPTSNETFWDFSGMLPQLLDFMSATAPRAVNMNIATHPCWLFTGLFGRDLNCSLPASSEQQDFKYGSLGSRTHLKDKSADTLAAYFARVFEYLSTGSFEDELGARHGGGPAFNFSRRASASTWEVFNEAEHGARVARRTTCHQNHLPELSGADRCSYAAPVPPRAGYTPETYTHDYDKVVEAIADRVGRDNVPNLIGIGGCISGFWSWWVHGSCAEWIPYFLNRSHHADPSVPLDYASIHYYASSNNRSRPDTYTAGFFGGADAFLQAMAQNVATRDALSPTTKLAVTEMGVLCAGCSAAAARPPRDRRTTTVSMPPSTTCAVSLPP